MHKKEEEKDGREDQEDLQRRHSIFDLPILQPHGQEQEQESKDDQESFDYDDYLFDCGQEHNQELGIKEQGQDDLAHHQMDQETLAGEQER